MKKKILVPAILFLAAGFLITINTLYAQSSIRVDASQLITNFKFTDSKGNVDDSYSPLFAGAYSVGYAYELDFGLFFNVGAGMRKAGATMVYDAANYQWNLQYAQAKLGTGYAYDLGIVKPYLGVSGYYGYLLKANQTVNNEDFDILDSESIKKDDYGLYFTPGLKINVSGVISVYTEYSYLMGLNNIETGDSGQETNIVSHVVTFGLSFTFE